MLAQASKTGHPGLETVYVCKNPPKIRFCSWLLKKLVKSIKAIHGCAVNKKSNFLAIGVSMYLFESSYSHKLHINMPCAQLYFPFRNSLPLLSLDHI